MPIYDYKDYLGNKYYPGLDYTQYVHSDYSTYWNTTKGTIQSFIYYTCDFIYLIRCYVFNGLAFKFPTIKYLIKWASNNVYIPIDDRTVHSDDKLKFASNIISQYFPTTPYDADQYGYIMANIMFHSFVKVYNSTSNISHESKAILIRHLNKLGISYAVAYNDKRILTIKNIIGNYEPLIIVNDDKFKLIGIIHDLQLTLFADKNFSTVFALMITDLIEQFSHYHVNVHNLCELTMVSINRVFDQSDAVYKLLSPFEGNVFRIQDTSRSVFYDNNGLSQKVFNKINIEELYLNLQVRGLQLVDTELFNLPYKFPFIDDYKLYRKTISKFVDHYLNVNDFRDLFKTWVDELNIKCRIHFEYMSINDLLTELILINTISHCAEVHEAGSLSYFLDYKNFPSIAGEPSANKYFSMSYFLTALYRMTGYHHCTIMDLPYDMFGSWQIQLATYREEIVKRNYKRIIPLTSMLPERIYAGVLF
jgi:hypothetical protein